MDQGKIPRITVTGKWALASIVRGSWWACLTVGILLRSACAQGDAAPRPSLQHIDASGGRMVYQICGFPTDKEFHLRTSLGLRKWDEPPWPVVFRGSEDTISVPLPVFPEPARYWAAFPGNPLPPFDGMEPFWRLSARQDFAGQESESISIWSGQGISGIQQSVTDARPTLLEEGVAFDGGDWLDFRAPATTSSFTFAISARIVAFNNFDMICGGGFDFNRALELQIYQGQLRVRMTNWDWDTGLRIPPSRQWRTLVLRRTAGGAVVHVDGLTASRSSYPASDYDGGTLRIGAGYSSSFSPAVEIREVAFFRRDVGVEGVEQLRRHFHALGDSPPSHLMLAHGQSNHGYGYSDMSTAWSHAMDSPSMLAAPAWSGRPLDRWVMGDEEGGFERTPLIDVSAAPPGTKASKQDPLQIGWDRMIGRFRDEIERHVPYGIEDKLAVFLQGESDADHDAAFWWVNDDGDWNRVGSGFERADSYGPRLLAFAHFLREDLQDLGLFVLVERVHFENAHLQTADQREAGRRQRASLLDALAQDPRILVLESEGVPKVESLSNANAVGVHVTNTGNRLADSPNTGAEIWGRSMVRLNQRKLLLASLPVDARLMCMRLVDAGFQMTSHEMNAFVRFAQTECFSDLRILTFPALHADNAFDQARLRRTNAVVHLAGENAIGLIPEAEDRCTAWYQGGGAINPTTMEAALEILLEDLGLSSEVSVREL